MKTIPLLHDESGSRKSKVQNVPGTRVTQRPSEATAGCNCDRWGHPLPNRAFKEPSGSTAHSNHNIPSIGAK